MPPEEQNKRKDNESQNTREYVQEHLQEHEVVQEEPTSVNAEGEAVDSYAVQNQEGGKANPQISGGFGGAGFGANTEEIEENETKVNFNTQAEGLSGLGMAGGGNPTAPLGDYESTPTKDVSNTEGTATAPPPIPPTSGGFGDLPPNDSGQNEGSGAGNGLGTVEQNEETSTNINEDAAAEASKLGENISDDLSKADDAKSELMHILHEVHEAEGRIDKKAAGAGFGNIEQTGENKNVDASGGFANEGAGANAAQGTTEEEHTTESTEQTNENAPQANAEQFMKDAGIADETKSSEEDTPDLEEIEKTEGQKEGLNAGRTAGLGKVVKTGENGELLIDKEEKAPKDIDAYVAETRATAKEKGTNYYSGFSFGFNQGYMEGMRLKREAKVMNEQREANSDPEMVQGKLDGTESGTKMNSKESVEKSRAESLKSAVSEKSAKYKKAFYPAFNKAYFASRRVSAINKLNAPTELLGNKNFKKGYDLGHKIGMAEGRKTLAEGMTEEQVSTARKNASAMGQDANDEEGKLYKKGFYTGLNKGFRQGRVALQGEKKKREEELQNNDPHYKAGAITGTLAGMFGKDKAMQVLTGGLMLEALGQGLPPIPDEVFEYYKNGTHQNQDPVDKKNFDKAYYSKYNKAYYLNKQKAIQQKRKTETGSEEYKKGYSIGEVAGAAASIQNKFERKLYPLEQKQKAQEDAIKNMGSSDDKTNYAPLIQPLKEKIARIQGHLDQIKEALNAEGANKDYKKGYHKAYNRAYLKEADSRVKAREAQRMNLGAQEKTGEQSADGSKSASFAEGFAMGKEIGILFYKRRKKARGNPEKTAKVNEQIEAAFNEARKKDADFTKGFFRGYNKTIFTGGGGGGGSMRDEAKTAKAALEAEAKQTYTKPIEIEYVKKGVEYAYKMHYESEKLPPAQRKGKSPEKKWQEYEAKLHDKIKDDLKAESKTGDSVKLKEAFTKGYELGKLQGVEHGQLFLAGYKDGVAGSKNSELTQFSYYKAGRKQGISEAQYQDFRDAALSGPNSLVAGYDAAQNSTKIKLEGQSDHYKIGYEVDYNNWLKIFWMASGRPELENMEGSLSLSDEEKINEEKKAADENFKPTEYKTDLVRARDYVSKVETKANEIIEYFRKRKHQEIINNIPQENRPKSGTSEYEELSKTTDEQIATSVEDFKNGYKAAIADAKKQVEAKQNTDLAYTEGLLFGYKNNTSQTLGNGDPMLDYAKLPQAIQDLTHNIEGKDQVYAQQGGNALIRFNEGRVRGLQLAQLVRTEGLSALDVMAELGGPAFKSGYKKGVEAAKSDVSSYKGALEDGQATEKLIELRENTTSTEYEGEALKGYEAAYDYHFAKGKVFADGFHVAKFVTTNEKEEDDYNNFEYQLEKEEWKEFEGSLIKEYRKGVVAGREAGLKEKYSSSEVSKELALQRRISQLREQTNKAYGDAYEMGYSFGTSQRNTENANIASIQARFELMGPAPLGTEIRTYIQHLLESNYDKLKEDLGKDEQKELLDAYKKIVEDFLPQLLDSASRDNRTPLENAKALCDGLNKEIEGFDADGFSEENKKAFFEQTKVWIEAANSFKEGYIRGARKGVVEGINIERANERQEAGNTVDDFFNQMMNSVSNKGNTHYIKGYQQARAAVHHLHKKDHEISKAKIEAKRYEVVNALRKDLHYFIQENYDEIKNNPPSSTDKNGMAIFLEQKIGFRHLSHHFNDKVELNMTEGQLQEDFIKAKEAEILDELRELIKSYDEKPNVLKDDENYKEVAERAKNRAVEFFEKQLEDNWSNFIYRYNEGHKAGYKKGIQEVLRGQEEGAEGISSGEANAVIDRIYEELKAGRIEDGDIGDIDWLDKADLLLIEIQDQREKAAQEKGFIYNSNEAIVDLMDEVKESEFERANIIEDMNAAEDELDQLAFQLELDSIDEELLNLERGVEEEEEKLNETYSRLNNQSNELRTFLREKVDFETSESSNRQINDYLLREENKLELDGTFSDTEGNAQVYKSGRLGLFDKDASWEIIGELLIGLGDLTVVSTGIYVHKEEYFVELEPGTVSVPLMEDNQMKELEFPFNYLELEMGMGMLEQVNQQLVLDDALNAGSLLLSNLFDWG